MRPCQLWKKGLSAGIILLFVALVWSPICFAQASAPRLDEKNSLQGSPVINKSCTLAQGFDMVFIWGTFEEKIHKFPLLSLEVRNRDPWDNHTITVFGLFRQGTTFHVYYIKAYWVACAPLLSLHLGLVGNNSLFVVATGRIAVYQ
ncbi:MAG TPA: hypothetical protein VMT57_03950 [Candidatus Thermoplasmatota archaeon]|nr:hypothetical protein [Candidatus Thermoplasmatota archaeon]